MVLMPRVFALRVTAALVLALPFATIAAPKCCAPAARGSGSGGPDEPFIAAREAFEKGDAAKLASHADAFRGHVLEPYLDSWRLRLRLDDAAPGEVSDFLGRYTGTLVAEQLRRDWLLLLGRKGQWELFEAAYPNLVNDDPEATCYALQARWRRGDESAIDEFRRLWASPRELPDGCVPIAEGELSAGRMTTRHVWERARLLLEAGQMTAAKRAIDYLPAGEQPEDRTLDSIQRAPQRFIAGAEKLDLKKQTNRELVLFAFARLARTDPEAAASPWTRKLQERFPPEDQAWVWGQLATQAARQHSPRALEWFTNANGIALRDEQLEWRVRAALREENWAEVQGAIEKMTPLGRNEPAWLYWHGRARRALGQQEEAQILFARVAGEHHFYGKLALEELGRPLAIPPRGYAPTPEDVTEVAGHPGVQRALALFRLEPRDSRDARELRLMAVREWNWTARSMDDRQLLAAAEIARRNEIWDRAISSADRTIGLHDFTVRFLAPYREVFSEQSKSQGLEESWVLGLVRQESRFITNARSSAGASGLMQLMPATARWVAKRIGMRDFSPARVNDVDVNVALGTTYLRYVLDELDGLPVLAAAAYNAGPGRARKWKADRPLEGAIYTETIPFNETRDYVKKVMSNTIYYAALYGGEARSLRARLGVIPPRRTGEGYAGTITGQTTVE
jgi:soluble lytic murein transglycosylase